MSNKSQILCNRKSRRVTNIVKELYNNYRIDLIEFLKLKVEGKN